MTRYDLGQELIETTSEEHALDRHPGRRRAPATTSWWRPVATAPSAWSAGALLDTDTALGMLPLGSIMNIPRMLDVPRDLDVAAAILATGNVRSIDVGVSGETLFYEAASIGLHAAVFRDISEVDQGHYWAILRSVAAAFRYRPSRMVVELDDGSEVATRALMVAVANGRFMGAGFTVAPDARLDDGLFDVRIFEHYSKWELVRHLREHRLRPSRVCAPGPDGTGRLRAHLERPTAAGPRRRHRPGVHPRGVPDAGRRLAGGRAACD